MLLSVFSFSGTVYASEAELKNQIQELKAESESQLQKINSLENKMYESRLRTPAADEKESSETKIGGYGEIHYNSYFKDKSKNQMDLHRMVLSIDHRFNEDISFFGELEWEHAIVSADDGGEAEVEQAYINYRLTPRIGLKVGLFLMPFGFLNESHEPPVFYGVERNEVETRIIPSTWREGGLGVTGTTEMGLDWGAGIVTGFDVAKFDKSAKPLGSIHQELQEAKAHDLSFYGTLNYRIPGITVGTSVFTGDSTQGNADFNENATGPTLDGINGRVTLGDLHARWQQYGFDVQGIFAKGMIGDAKTINDRIQTYNTANPTDQRTLVPEEFYGWLAQVAYTFPVGAKATISPFVRYEFYDTQSKMSSGLAADPANKDYVTTAGVSFHPIAQVVFKGDYQSHNDHTDQDRFDLGVGYMF
jgi:hypothetical protein